MEQESDGPMSRKLKSSEVKAVREILLEQQDGKCAICGKPPVVPCVDHRHPPAAQPELGYIRGVLCSGCNIYEGKVAKWQFMAQVDDLPTWLENLATYLRKHETDQTGLIHPSVKTPEERKARAKKRALKRKAAK